MNNQEWHQCSVCQRIFVRPEIEYKVDPYRSTILGEGAPVWICQTCYEERQVVLRRTQKTQKSRHEHSIGVIREKAIMGKLKAEVKRII